MMNQTTQFISIDCDGYPLNAVWRLANSASITKTVFIICPGIGTDYNNAYRNFRYLARSLNQAGFDTLTIDYLATGSSSDGPETLNVIEKFEFSITSAVSFCRAHYQNICLIGFRVGATLALKYAADYNLDGVVAWSPILKGKSFLREVKLLAASAELNHETSEDLEISGVILDPPTQAYLAQIDITQMTPRARETLCVLDATSKRLEKVIDRWRECDNTSVTVLESTETQDLLIDAHLTKVASATNQAIVDTVATWFDNNEMHNQEIPKFVSELVINHSFIETCCFDGARFSVRCQPTDVSKDKPVILFLSSGSNHNVGPHRLYVELSRKLASSGFTSYRVDMPGLGETPAEDLESENFSYMPKPTDFLERFVAAHDLQHSSLILIGLCSGAFHSFKAAAESETMPIKAIIPINPLTFYWQQGMTIDDAPSVNFSKWSWYRQSMKDINRWKKLFSGKVAIKPIIAVIAERIKSQLKARSTNQLSEPENANGKFEVNQNITRTLHRIDELNRPIRFIFSENDPGLEILKASSKKAFNQQKKKGQISVSFIANADHTFSRQAVRKQLIDQLLAELSAVTEGA
ncbi:MAG: hypothetical protein HWE11_01620 [Gammaproteobacteria bacterium]|nr:hypothetical protein [Gammaproteobacteria bacterium]